MKIVNKDNTHKKKIINNIISAIGLPATLAKKIIDNLVYVIISNILEKKYLKIKNFGRFDLKNKKKRIGRNPKNKAVNEILERNVITFKASAVLSKKINTYVKK